MLGSIRVVSLSLRGLAELADLRSSDTRSRCGISTSDLCWPSVLQTGARGMSAKRLISLVALADGIVVMALAFMFATDWVKADVINNETFGVVNWIWAILGLLVGLLISLGATLKLVEGGSE